MIVKLNETFRIKTVAYNFVLQQKIKTDTGKTTRIDVGCYGKLGHLLRGVGEHVLMTEGIEDALKILREIQEQCDALAVQFDAFRLPHINSAGGLIHVEKKDEDI